MGERSILELLLRTKKSGTATKDTTAELKKLKTASAQAGKAAERLNLGQIAVAGAILTAGIAALRQIPVLMDLGVQATRAETGLRGLAGGSEEAAAALAAVQAGAGGSIDRIAAATAATKLFSMGLASTAEEAGKLTETAVTLGAAMGKGPQQAFEQFTLLLANQSILRLDTFGISAGRVRDRMRELAAETPNMTREARFLQATLEQAEVSMKKLELAGFEASSSLDRIRADATNAKIAVGQFLADGLLPWIDGIRDVVDATKEQKQWLEETSAGIESQIVELEALRDASSDAVRETYNAQIAELEAKNARIEHETAMQAEIDRLNGLAGMYAEATEAADENAEANRNIVASLGELTQAKLAAEALKAINTAFKEGEIDADEYERSFVTVATKIAGMDADATIAQLSMFRLNQEFDRTGNLDGYIEGLEDLGEKTGAIERPDIAFDEGALSEGIVKDMEAAALNAAAIAVNAGDESRWAAATELASGFGGSIWDAYTAIDDTITRLGELEDKEITITINTVGAIPEFQHGGSFTVGGPPGVDNTPVFFMASRGEEVSVTPAARSPGGGGGGGGGRGGPLIGTFISYGKDDDMVFAEQLKRIARRS